MKIIKILLILIFAQFSSHVYAWSENDIIEAQFLAEKGVIVDRGQDYAAYNFSSSITRREMLKVMMNTSGLPVSDVCEGRFSDMPQDDWGCKYAEAALKQGFIAANTTFRPDDKVTKIEALKMILQAQGIERNIADDWREGYVSKAFQEGIISKTFSDFNTISVRSWVFHTTALSYEDAPEFLDTTSENELTPEEEELLNHFLNI